MSQVETIAEGITLHLGEAADVLPSLRADATITDPAYGINAARDRKSQKHGWRDYSEPGWDKDRTPPELVSLAVSRAKHAIVWGGNYWTDALPPTSKWLSWDKGQTDFSLADFELAWCSFDGAARRITYPRSRALQDGKEHPTQKPIEVMRWCIQQLPKGCRTILDPFMGAGTTGVAAVELGLQFIGVERVPAYFDIACRRVEEATRRPDMFVQVEKRAIEIQQDLLVTLEPASDYSPRDDFNKSINACYEAVRERIAEGGPGWDPDAALSTKDSGG